MDVTNCIHVRYPIDLNYNRGYPIARSSKENPSVYIDILEKKKKSKIRKLK